MVLGIQKSERQIHFPPLVDLRDTNFSAALIKCFEEIGFAFITSPQWTKENENSLLEASEYFFNLDAIVKDRIRSNATNSRGYYPYHGLGLGEGLESDIEAYQIGNPRSNDDCSALVSGDSALANPSLPSLNLGRNSSKYL